MRKLTNKQRKHLARKAALGQNRKPPKVQTRAKGQTRPAKETAKQAGAA